jgi:hypothetical protein
MLDEGLTVDPKRMDFPPTGIFVRARVPAGGYGSFDIVQLDAPSLQRWLRSRGGNNEWAEAVVALLLGHRVDTRLEGMKTSSV